MHKYAISRNIKEYVTSSNPYPLPPPKVIHFNHLSFPGTCSYNKPIE